MEKDKDSPELVAAVVEAEQQSTAVALRPRWVRVAKLCFSAAVLLLLAVIVDWAEFARVISSARLDILLVAAALLMIGNVIIAWRWQVLLEPVGIQTSLRQALESYLKGHFLSFFVPSGVTADVVKAVDMNNAPTAGRRKKGMELASSIFVERGFGAVTVGMAVALGLVLSPLVGRNADLHHLMGLAAGLIVLCCILALYTDKFLLLIPRSWTHRWPRLATLASRAQDSFAAYRSVPETLALVLVQSVIIQMLRIIPVYVIAVAIGFGGEFFPFVIAVPLIFLTNMIPVIGSRIGTEQGLFVLLLGLAGVKPETALAIALISLVLGMLTALPGGYWLISGRSRAPTSPSSTSVQ